MKQHIPKAYLYPQKESQGLYILQAWKTRNNIDEAILNRKPL